MCWPSCKGGAYLATSVFIYRSMLVIISMIASSLTRLKSTYLPITILEELLLQLIYFILLFTSSSFVFIGLENNSFNFVFFSGLALGWTLFLRYSGELAYIYLYNWDSFRLKVPTLGLNLTLDLILIYVIILYARKVLRKRLPWASSKSIHDEELTLGQGTASSQALCQNLSLHHHNQFHQQQAYSTDPKVKDTNLLRTPPEGETREKSQESYSSLIYDNVSLGPPPGKKFYFPEKTDGGIGQGMGKGTALHYPIKMDEGCKGRPRRPTPRSDEMDDISLPPPVPLASPDYDYV